jgi:uncharacterized MAPEG superfamily protein
MTLAAWMILVAAILPYATIAAAKWTDPGYNNHDPRGWALRAAGWRGRLVGAQQNAFEGFPFFAAAVLLAQQSGARQDRVDELAVGYIVARLGYTICYAADRPSLRSAVWTLGFLCAVAIFLAAA